MAEWQGVEPSAAPERQVNFQKATNVAGALVSLALLAGIGIWGYKLIVRDVSGVPVVKAAEGPMRVQPDDPGGDQAQHQGLAVNDVAAVGAAARPADRLVLAPEPLTLSLEDTPQVQPTSDQTEDQPSQPDLTAGLSQLTEVTPTAEAEDAVAPDTDQATLAALNALADQLSEGAVPLGGEQVAQPAEDAAEPTVQIGLGRSLRPQARPASIASTEDAIAHRVAAAAAAASQTNTNIDPASIPPGTRMAQLGAYASADIAVQEWGKLSDRMGEFLEGKQMVVQRAQSGGRTFYRLRAMGFADLNDARRFCSALVAEKAECIPVVTR